MRVVSRSAGNPSRDSVWPEILLRDRCGSVRSDSVGAVSLSAGAGHRLLSSEGHCDGSGFRIDHAINHDVCWRVVRSLESTT